MVMVQAATPEVGATKTPAALTVRLFAGAAELIRVRTWYLPVVDGMTIADVFEGLCEVFPSLSTYRDRLHYALNAEYAGHGSLVRAGDEVCLIPPVSGGAAS